MSVKRYILKFINKTVGELEYDEDNDLFSMNITNPSYFFGRLDKLFFTDKMVRDWIESRLTPEYQGGYTKFVRSCGLRGDEPNLRWKLFLATRGTNVKDKMWLAFNSNETFETSCPWYKILHPELFPDALEDISNLIIKDE